MRADAHYVDQLVVPASRRAADDTRGTPAATLAAETAATKPSHQLLLDDHALVASMNAVLSCTSLLSDETPRFARHVAVDMIRAETLRAMYALRTARLLRAGVTAERRLVDPRAWVMRVLEAVAPETRLRACKVSSGVEGSESARLRVDETSLTTAVASTMLMLLAGLQDLQGARLDVRVTSGGGRVTIVVAQEAVILPDACLHALSALHESVTPETAPLAALRLVAEASGGHAAAVRLPHGTQVSIDLPAADAT